MFLFAALLLGCGVAVVMDEMLEESAREAKKRQEKAHKRAKRAARRAAEEVRAHHAHVAAGLDERLHRMDGQ
jgi:ElaB/YqjD/DUF883 family membrane-anchored ribosome-binding protein